ncbi:MAG: hypothetical protein WC679_06385 [Bacteroidales bacterium]|jgi:hypothetical protein
MKKINLRFKSISTLIVGVAALSICLFSACEEKEDSRNSKLLMLKVDYLTNNFEGGKETIFSEQTSTFTITTQYDSPGDFGNIRLTYQELNEIIFDGSIIWMGRGEMSIPQNILSANQFNRVSTDDFVYPSGGFENVFNPSEEDYDYSQIWISVQGLVKVREYLNSNPSASVKIFLYTPSVGVGDPADWDWIIFIKN